MARAGRKRTLLLSRATHVQLDYDRAFEDEPRRPYVVLELVGPNGTAVPLQGLLDTGADYTTLPLAIAAELGFGENDLRPLPGSAAGGRPILLRKATQPVKARLERSPLEFELEPRFIQVAGEGAARPADLLWGRRDFLWHWDIELSERDKRLALEWRL